LSRQIQINATCDSANPTICSAPINESGTLDTGKEQTYPQDSRGHSCLMLGYGDGDRALHIVCSPKDEYLAVITAYIPDTNQWIDDFKSRRKP